MLRILRRNGASDARLVCQPVRFPVPKSTWAVIRLLGPCEVIRSLWRYLFQCSITQTVRAAFRGMRMDARSYSCRNISAGSSDDARMAGRMAAEAAIRKNSPAMLTKVKGSVGLVPTKMAIINRVRTKLPARPMLSPITINRNPSLNISSRIWRFFAPRAIRMPISAVRCRTAEESTP